MKIMEKLVKVPFNVETAKKIQSGEIEGKIVTRDGRDVHVIYWDKKGVCPIVALIFDSDNEVALSFLHSGRYLSENEDHNFDLFLEVPEWATFKAGDLVSVGNGTYLIVSILHRCKIGRDNALSASYAASVMDGRLNIDFNEGQVSSSSEFTNATKADRKKFIHLLKEDGSDKANKILEKYFGIKTKPKYKTGDILYLKDKSGADFVFINNVTAGISSQYCVLPTETKSLIFAGVYPIYGERVTELRYATKEERQMLRDALIKDGRAEAKEYLAEFFKEDKYKDGDILYVKNNYNKEYVFIHKEGAEKTYRYCSVGLSEGNVLFTGYQYVVCDDEDIISIRYATESEKGVLLEALKESDTDVAKECLKRFFNIEQEGKFKPFDKVLVRDSYDEIWHISFFGFCLNTGKFKYRCLGSCFKQCIKYEGNEHLLGTTDEPKH